MGTLHICAPTSYRIRPFTRECPDCGRHSWFIGVHTPWYGVQTGCLRCGRQWADGEWMPLDFVPKSRQRSIAALKRRYRRALSVPVCRECAEHVELCDCGE